MTFDHRTCGVLYTFDRDLYAHYSSLLSRLGVDVTRADPDPGEGVPDPTLLTMGFFYSHESISNYLVHRAKRLDVDLDSLLGIHKTH